MTTRAQFGAIHTLKKASRLEEGEYRALLDHHTGKTSSKDLSDAVAGRFIEVLKGCVGQAPSPKPRADRATGHYAPVLQALWISGHTLGLIADPSDAAMMRFVARQTGLSHTRFLVDPADARRAIEALKQWLARAGVRWAAYPDDPRGRKLAVLEAVAMMAVRADGFVPVLDPEAAFGPPWVVAYFVAYGAYRGLPAHIDAYSEADIIQLTRWLGERLAAARQGHRKGGARARH